jgi:hypothetical protein
MLETGYVRDLINIESDKRYEFIDPFFRRRSQLNEIVLRIKLEGHLPLEIIGLYLLCKNSIIQNMNYLFLCWLEVGLLENMQICPLADRFRHKLADLLDTPRQFVDGSFEALSDRPLIQSVKQALELADVVDKPLAYYLHLRTTHHLDHHLNLTSSVATDTMRPSCALH